jgi:hypothetical protein
MRILPFGIRRLERSYTPRPPRVELIGMDASLKRCLEDSVDRRHFDARRKSSSLRQMAERSYRAGSLFDWGRDGFNTKSLGWTTDAQKAMLLDTTVAGTWLKLITGGVTNAAPAVYTSAAHGFANNDVVVASNIGGNLSTNQTGLATAVATNTLQLTTLEGQPVNGSAAYTLGGFLLNLTQAKFVADILGTRVSTDQAFAGTSSSRGVSNATSPLTWPSVPIGNPVYIVFYDAAGGSDATNRLVGWQDGRVRVITVGDTPITSLTMKIQPIRGQLWDGLTGPAPVMWFSNGFSATLNAAALLGADSLTLLATGHDIPDLQTADVATFGAGIPVTPSGASISWTIGSIYAPLTPQGVYKL